MAYDYATKFARMESLRLTLRSERASFDADWRDLADYIAPKRYRYSVTERNQQGSRRRTLIVDGTASMAAKTLQSGLHAGLTSPARPWMRLSTPNPKLAENTAVKTWLYETSQRMLTTFAQSNLYNVLPAVYGDMGTFGTSAMSILDDEDDLFRATSYPVGSYDVALDGRGVCNTFAREYILSVQQLIEQFGGEDGGGLVPGDKVNTAQFSQTVRDHFENGQLTQPIRVVWLITRNDAYDRDAVEAKFYRYASCHWEFGQPEGKFLRESGFKTMPVMAPRWDVTGEDSYGTECPGMIAIGDVKQLQLMQREKAKAIQKIVNPPVQGPMHLRSQKTSLLAGDITYVDARDAQSGLRPIHEVRIDLGDLSIDIQQVQQRIKRAYFEDLFLMLAYSDPSRGMQPVTAREVEERHEEKLLALGPVLERTNDELLDPLVDRVFSMMIDAGLVEDAPDELQGVDLKVEYISIMAQAQRLVGVVSMDRFVQTMQGAMTSFPSIAMKLNTNQIVDSYADILGIDPRLVRSNEEADGIAAQQAQAQAKMEEAQQAHLLAKSAKDASQASMEGDNALSRLMGGQQQMTGSAAAL